MPHPAEPGFTASDARWLAHRYAAVDDRVHYRFVPREEHAAFPFLTDDNIGSAPAATLPRGAALAGAGSGVPVHFIFHSAFCASTLLCRAFDRPGTAMGLSEPVILNDIVGIRRRGEADPRRVGELIDAALRLLARPWGADAAVVVKPSNVLNPLAAGLLTLRPAARAILLHAPLDTFLASVARKGMWCRLWVRELIDGYLGDGFVDLGFDPPDYLRQTDLQIAAIGWLAQHRLFHALAARFPDRIATLDSETLLGDPAGALAHAFRHLALPLAAADARQIAEGPVFARHSKFGTAFSSAARRQEQEAAAEAHGEEIAYVAAWARVVAEKAGIALALPRALL